MCIRDSCEGNRLEQVLVNLLVNAFDAIAEAGDADADMPRRVRIVARSTAGGVALEVHDNGPGIAPEAMPRLFEPFFTTKEQGLGLGLGLAISAGIVRDFGGLLRAGRVVFHEEHFHRVRFRHVIFPVVHGGAMQ